MKCLDTRYKPSVALILGNFSKVLAGAAGLMLSPETIKKDRRRMKSVSIRQEKWAEWIVEVFDSKSLFIRARTCVVRRIYWYPADVRAWKSKISKFFNFVFYFLAQNSLELTEHISHYSDNRRKSNSLTTIIRFLQKSADRSSRRRHGVVITRNAESERRQTSVSSLRIPMKSSSQN